MPDIELLMDPVVAIVLALLVVATIGWVALRGRRRELPPPTDRRIEAHAERKPLLPSKEAPPEEAQEVAAPEAPGGLSAEAPSEEATAEPSAPARAEAPTPPTAEQAERQLAVYKKGLTNTRNGFVARLASLFGRHAQIDATILDEVEEVLIMADIGVRTTARILDALRNRVARGELSHEADVWSALRHEAFQILGQGDGRLNFAGKRPFVILVVGVNGVGKTTTIGKLAARLDQEGRKVMLAAGDTFRAAAVAQLEVWGRRVGCPVVKGKEGADPASVIFDAIKQAEADEADVLIADTAGRLHTKAPLMEELKKVGRTATKALGRAPDEVLLVLDATTGQNAVQQAHLFRQALDLTGIVLTKLDGTAKGGVIMGIVDEHRIPVRYIGLGERIEDLREFDAQAFVAAMFTRPEDESAAA